MGEYYLTINLDKKQYIDPHAFGDGAKLFQQPTTGQALIVLTADGNDLNDEYNNPIVGAWAGDRIVVAGDDVNEEHKNHRNLYEYALANYEDVSEQIQLAVNEAVTV